MMMMYFILKPQKIFRKENDVAVCPLSVSLARFPFVFHKIKAQFQKLRQSTIRVKYSCFLWMVWSTTIVVSVLFVLRVFSLRKWSFYFSSDHFNKYSISSFRPKCKWSRDSRMSRPVTCKCEKKNATTRLRHASASLFGEATSRKCLNLEQNVRGCVDAFISSYWLRYIVAGFCAILSVVKKQLLSKSKWVVASDWAEVNRRQVDAPSLQQNVPMF